ncbi:hypothetical protein QG37_06223 [Candidozyma auris]|uniref:Uncharacterized protein n=1 Tax=Candidozyma auris TaxID=498019 RepID=A0A0L0NUU2_CANAR|nr:hypothetical protein QG37_06223 [[Candida] auris]
MMVQDCASQKRVSGAWCITRVKKKKNIHKKRDLNKKKKRIKKKI